MLDVCKSLISHPNYFESVDRIQFHSVNDASLYDDRTHNQFSHILLLDALLWFELKLLIDLFVKRLSLAIKQHINTLNNVDKQLQINNEWWIKLLDKKQLYRNEETSPNFDYTPKGISKRVRKAIKINDSQFKTFRKMIPNLINSNDKNKGNLIRN